MTSARKVVEWIPAIVVFCLGIVVWQLAIDIFNIQKFLLPKPWSIVSAFWTQRGTLWSAGWLTLKEALGGFAIGSALGILFAVILARFRRVSARTDADRDRRQRDPDHRVLADLQRLVRPALARAADGDRRCPLLLPGVREHAAGPTSVRPSQIELMRSYAAGELEIFRRVRVPTALPFVFSALKVATRPRHDRRHRGDYFGTSDRLGITIKNSVSLFDFETAWAAILIASILGVAMYVAVVARRTLRPPVGSNASGKGHCMKRKSLLALALAAVVAAAIAATLGMSRAQAAPKLTHVTLQLKWVTQSQFAGYYAAVEKGYYKKAGLDVTLKVGGPDVTPEQVVLAGQADFGLDWLPNLFATREKGGKIVSVAQVFARSGMTELTWKDSGINTITKMKNKKVGVWCCGNQPELFAALTKNGINPRLEERGHDRQPAVRRWTSSSSGRSMRLPP